MYGFVLALLFGGTETLRCPDRSEDWGTVDSGAGGSTLLRWRVLGRRIQAQDLPRRREAHQEPNR